MRHVVLVGLMGSGKTTVGRRAAKLLGRPFVDADEAFVPRYGCTVAEVFAERGEAEFRRLESALLSELLAVETPLLIASGGGVVTVEANREALRRPDVLVIHLDATPAFLASRVQRKADRPLLQGQDLRTVLGRLHAERARWYEEVADERVDVDAFHERASQPKKAMAQRVAALVLERAEVPT